MRLPNYEEDLVGKVCINSTGRVAIVTGIKQFDWGEAWVGIGFDGKGTWASSSPVVTAEDAEEFRERISNRFRGKMSWLD